MTVDRDFVGFTTARLRVRRFRPQDAPAFAAYRCDPEVARYQSWATYSRADADRFIQEIADISPGEPGQWFQFAVTLRDDDALIGDVALRAPATAAERPEMGFTFAQDQQGKGYATEAARAVVAYGFERLEFPVITAVTDARNDGSIALLERIGMRMVGTARAHFKGAWCDEHTYELRPESA